MVCMMNNKNISIIYFADDVAIIAESEDDLQRQLFKLHQITRNPSKCKHAGHDPTKDLRSQVNRAVAMPGSLRELVRANQRMRKVRKIKI